ncbi:MAG: hypothetical protein ACRDOY_09360, partial [Nocardioidaceae bacterium]
MNDQPAEPQDPTRSGEVRPPWSAPPNSPRPGPAPAPGPPAVSPYPPRPRYLPHPQPPPSRQVATGRLPWPVVLLVAL